MRRLQERAANVPIVIITAHGDLQTAVDAVRGGAFEYLTKPFELDKLQRTLQRALSAPMPRQAPEPTGAPGAMVGSSPAMQELFRQIALVADSQVNVLISGESGSGKELAARAIHRYSRRSDGPFVAVNVAALSPTLAESELFGHARGAFTGADRQRDGLLVQANGGTLFLDEVADIPLPLQVKLLRALEHGQIVPVGSSEPVATNFRVLSATHQDLLARVHEGQFRHDLYFRLCAFQLNIPPLRARREDIVMLSQHFLALAAAGRTPLPRLSDAVIKELEARPWYGNIRELRNAIDHAVVVARGGTIELEHLPAPVVAQAPGTPFGNAPTGQLEALLRAWTREQLRAEEGCEDLYERYLGLVEPPLLETVVEHHQGQLASAARTLGLHRTTLRKKLRSPPVAGDD